MSAPICRDAEEAFAAGWDDGADDAPMTAEQHRKILALLRPYRDELTAPVTHHRAA